MTDEQMKIADKNLDELGSLRNGVYDVIEIEE